MVMKVETRIKLSKFVPRPYQLDIIDALENEGYKRVMAIWPRRAGKDIVGLNLIIRAALRRIGVYYYIFPTYSQAKKVIWDSITISGEKFLDYIPKELIASTNATEMKIKLTNGSLLQLVGSDNFDSLMGTNPLATVFSEYSLQDPRAWQYIRPILLANDGWALFLSTPRGKNHLFELYEIAKDSKEWFVDKLTVEDTKHIPIEAIEREIAAGEMSDDLARQEYWTDFSLGVEGSYYSKYIDRARLKGQIGHVPYEPGYPVHTAWDIGVADHTAIIFFQVVGQIVRVIDYYEKNGVGLDHFVKVIQSKEYVYGKHFAPHDMRQRVWTEGGMTRIEKARQMGINFVIAPEVSIIDGIEAVRALFAKLWIDQTHCENLIKALENYRSEYDPQKRLYKSSPLHNWASHACDAMRYLALSIPKTAPGLTPEELDRRYNEAMNPQGNFPKFFQDDGNHNYY
jgi:phage terminase large subunit